MPLPPFASCSRCSTDEALNHARVSGSQRSLRLLRSVLILCSAASLMACDRTPASPIIPVRGANLIQSGQAPLDSAASTQSLMELKRLGANTVAIVPFLWQQHPQDPNIGFGTAVTDAQLVGGIRAAHAQGFQVVLKPHVWVPGHWAGEIEMASAEHWELWFDNYRKLMLHYAQLAAGEQVEVLSLGTELKKTSQHPRWQELISAVRRVYPGRLTYSAHGVEELASLPFKDKLDIISLTLYVDLTGYDGAEEQALRIRETLGGIREQVKAFNRPVWISELGFRALSDAHRKPWESPEQRDGPADAIAQARLFAVWLDEIRAARLDGLLIWYWNSDPQAGGPHNTDFTVQNKATAGVLLCQWGRLCR